jgi:tmRNA-binding protein
MPTPNQKMASYGCSTAISLATMLPAMVTMSEVTQRGLTLVPLKLYIKHGIAKIELGIAKGKKAYDKREVIAQREAEREMDRALKSRRM